MNVIGLVDRSFSTIFLFLINEIINFNRHPVILRQMLNVTGNLMYLESALDLDVNRGV